jgi:TolB-like protein/DNA-binding winged helix-turn-helix (wHTH) protein/tetratricopeptide (TPR) repeat protein
MQPQPAHLIYEFGDFELDALRRVLVSRADGQQVDITGRVFEALVYFVERPGQLVDKKALIEALWPHVVVEEGNLTQTIHTLRRVLGERPGEHRYIATVPGRGYRFVADVRVRTEQTQLDAVPSRRSTTTVLAGAALLLVLLTVVAVLAWRGRGQPVVEAAVPARPSIAVLPFVDMSTEQDQEPFAEGLSEEILNLLAHSDALRVIARTSSFSFKNQNADIGTIAQRLAVSHVLEGSVRKSGERVRITAQLIDGSTSAHVWSETYDRDEHDIFGVQREIAAAVADALHVTLHRVGPRRAETSSVEAYEHYLQGRHLFNRRSGADLLQAKSHLEKAVQIDPDYGRAWAALAGVYLVARYEDLELPNEMQNWREAVERAVALAPDVAEAHVRAAQYYLHAGDPNAARMHIARATALDPEEPLLVGRSLTRIVSEGRLEDTIELQRGVVATDPLSANNRGTLGNLLMMVGRLTEAQAELERALELSPAAVGVTGDMADLLILQGRADEALRVSSRMPAGYDRDRHLALAYFARGDVSEGNAMLARLFALAEKPDFDPPVAVAIAEVYAARNDPDHAFEWLDTARRRSRSQPGVLPARLLQDDLQFAPFLKALHADPRWGQLLAAVGTSAGSGVEP